MVVTLKLRTHVQGRRLVLAETNELLDGTELELVSEEDSDKLDDDDCARLQASLKRSAEQFGAGRGIDATEALARLQQQR